MVTCSGDDGRVFSMFNRREFLIRLSAVSLLIASGCATFRRRSELEEAFAELETLLNQASDAYADQLASIVKHIQTRSQTLVKNHQTFVEDFNRMASKRSVTAEELQKMVDNYDHTRKKLRNDLLYLQDELHAALPPRIWPEVVEVLNCKSQTIAAKKLSRP